MGRRRRRKRRRSIRTRRVRDKWRPSTRPRTRVRTGTRARRGWSSGASANEHEGVTRGETILRMPDMLQARDGDSGDAEQTY